MDVLAAGFDNGESAAILADLIGEVREFASHVGLQADTEVMQRIPDVFAVELEPGVGGPAVVIQNISF